MGNLRFLRTSSLDVTGLVGVTALLSVTGLMGVTALLSVTACAGCGAATPAAGAPTPGTSEVTLEIDHYHPSCDFAETFSGSCLRMREVGAKDFEKSPPQIAGFKASWGKSYVIKVRKTTRAPDQNNPDAPIVSYALLSVVKETTVAPPAPFSFKVDLDVGVRGGVKQVEVKGEGKGVLPDGQAFSCERAADCERLLVLQRRTQKDLEAGGFSAELHFEYGKSVTEPLVLKRLTEIKN